MHNKTFNTKYRYTMKTLHTDRMLACNDSNTQNYRHNYYMRPIYFTIKKQFNHNNNNNNNNNKTTCMVP